MIGLTKLIVYSSAGMSNLKTFFTGKKVVDMSKKNRMIKNVFQDHYTQPFRGDEVKLADFDLACEGCSSHLIDLLMSMNSDQHIVRME